MSDERWLTIDDVSFALQVQPNTVRQWLRNGDLVGHDFGGKTGYRVRERDLDDFIDRRLEVRQKKVRDENDPEQA